jgi:hypothetical protein
MAAYPKYEEILDTPGLAFEFNEFVKSALAIEKLVLDHFKYRDDLSKKRAAARKRRTQ